MRVVGGYTNYGQNVGILMLETVFPRIVGDVGNARTFPFPVKYRIVKDVFPDHKIPSNADEVLLNAFIKAAKELEQGGCRAITTSCGFLAGFQKELAEAVDIPVFTSVLALIPLIHTMVGAKKSIGIFTEKASLMTEYLFQRNGWSEKDIPIHVSGLPEQSDFSRMVISDHVEGNLEGIRECIAKMTEEHMEKYPDTGAIVLECQNFAPYGERIQEIADVPVFGLNQMVEFIEHCVEYPHY